MSTRERRAARVIQERSVSTRALLLEGAARVFSRLPYAEARLKDVADESGISSGSLYFHFGNKVDMAQAVLQLQQQRMSDALTAVLGRRVTGLDSLLSLTTAMADLISSDVVVQAGIKLGMQPGTGLESDARAPYFEWIELAASLIQKGVDDGSIEPTVDVHGMAEYVNVLFVGAQVLSELEDSWQSFPDRCRRMRPRLVEALAPRVHGQLSPSDQ